MIFAVSATWLAVHVWAVENMDVLATLGLCGVGSRVQRRARSVVLA